MKELLVVEDSSMVMKVLRHVLAPSAQFSPQYATSFAEARALLDSGEHAFFAALVDLSLPDAPDGEVVDYTLNLKIPTVVLTGSFDERKRELLLDKGIVDYVTKEGRFSYEYALGVLNRMVKNASVKVLVVDDSPAQRRFVRGLLRLHHYQVVEAGDGREAIKVLLANQDTKILITDYNMPNMDGFELVKTIRGKYEKTDLIIIGVSSEVEGALSAKFIKYGANDFLRKPFNHEEFFCRITHNIEFLELVAEVRNAAYRDDLTGCYNRRYFFETATDVHERAVANAASLSLAMIELDNFWEINQHFGHELGNFVMQRVSEILSTSFDRFLLARAGGQEFFVLMSGLSNDKAVAFVDRVRQILGSEVQSVGDEALKITFSSGVTSVPGDSLDSMLSSATACLYRAKEAGGDLVFGDDEERA